MTDMSYDIELIGKAIRFRTLNHKKYCSMGTRISGQPVLRVRLREAIALAERRTGERVTYDFLARSTGLSRATIEALGSRPGYNPRLSTIERLCQVLEVSPGELLEWSDASHDEPGVHT